MPPVSLPPMLVHLAAFLALGIPPLSAEQRTALATAIDGARDHQEPAFAALLEHVSSWDGELGDAPIRLSPDFAAMKADPDSFRGELCRIVGTIEMIEPLRPPFDGIDAWFVRVRNAGEVPGTTESGVTGEPVLVFVDVRTERDAQRARFRLGDDVSIDARFYKRCEHLLDAPGQDGQVHAYASFVGAFPRPGLAGALPASRILAVIGPLVVILGGAFVLLLLATRRGRSHGRRGALATESIALDAQDHPSLPADPAEALATLRRLSERSC